MEVFTDHEITLDHILSFDQSRELFRDFMSKEKSLGKIEINLIFIFLFFLSILEVLDFYQSANEFANSFRELQKKEREALQKKIFKQLGAIGFSDNVKQQVEAALKNPSATSFKLPARQVLEF